MIERFLGDRVTLHAGDCREVLAQLAADSIDACVTDPPYHLVSISERFGPGQKPAGDGRYGRLSRGFMGKVWDGGDIAFDPATWHAVWRVLKPGAYLLALGGTRTYHRLACAIEDAGFDVRDMIAWTYGSGFPKSHDISKGIDRAAGVERAQIRTLMGPTGNKYCKGLGDGRPWMEEASAAGYHEHDSDEPITDAARQWDGWGTALKPALEPICLARKPLSEATIAANVLRWGTGGLNIDGCRIANPTGESAGGGWGWSQKTADGSMFSGIGGGDAISQQNPNGRWPANLIHDGSEDVRAAFPESGPASDRPRNNGAFDSVAKGHDYPHTTFGYADNGGSAARFFYTAKADSDDRLGSKHPTVKPLDLIQYLARLVTPPRGTVLDPFAGTGTTGEAAWREGFSAVLIEAEAEYQADIRRRMALALSGPDERAREAIKARNLPRDDGPLFAPRETWADMWARPFDFSQLKDPPG